MGERVKPPPPPGGTVLGGSAAGFSYEGARHDALAREEAARRAEAGHARLLPVPPARLPAKRAERG